MKKIFNILLSEKIIVPISAILIAIIVYKIIGKLIKKVKIKGSAFEVKRFQTIFRLTLNIIKYIIMGIVIIIILSVYGVSTTALLTSLGAIGVVGGFAFQDIIKDLYTGINIIIDDYFVIGDTIRYEEFEGIVTDFGLKTTKIESVTGEVLIVANRNLHSIINLSINADKIKAKKQRKYEKRI